MAVSKAKIAALVKKALVATGDLKITAAYTQVTPGVYDPATNEVATTEVTVTVQCINAKLKSQELDWFPADLNTQKLLIAAVDLPFDPKADDYVTIDMVRWEVKRVQQVPGNSLHIVYIQEP